MKITDGKRTVEINIQRWTGSGWGEDWSKDYFGTDGPYDADTDTYIVDDVDYCITCAESNNPYEGACFVMSDDGPVPDPDVAVTVTDLPTVPTGGAL